MLLSDHNPGVEQRWWTCHAFKRRFTEEAINPTSGGSETWRARLRGSGRLKCRGRGDFLSKDKVSRKILKIDLPMIKDDGMGTKSTHKSAIRCRIFTDTSVEGHQLARSQATSTIIKLLPLSFESTLAI